MIRIRILVIFVLMVLGFVIVALPDTGPRLFSISSNHGPSLQDAVGLFLILLPYSCLVAMSWRRREKVRIYQNSSIFKIGLFLFGLGLGLVVASVFNDHQYWWICGGIIMLVFQIPLFYITLK